MPTYVNSNLILKLSYSSTQPAANAVYTDVNGVKYTFLVVAGSGTTATYGVNVIGYNNMDLVTGTLTKVSGTGDSTVTLDSWTHNPVAIIGMTRIEPGQTVVTNEWLLNLPYYVVQTLATPFADPTIYSAQITGTTTVSVPSTCIDSSTGNTIPLTGNYKVHVYVTAGNCTVKVNSSSAVARYLGVTDSFDVYCRDRIVDNIIVTIASSATVDVSIDKV